MGTAAQIPASNPAGKNQMNPGAAAMGLPPAGSTAGIPGSPSFSTQANPFMAGVTPQAAIPGAPTTSPAAAGTPAPQGAQAQPGTAAANGFITSGTDAGQNALQKQLDDIYGQGVGGSLFSLLNNMSGTNSQVLQEYIASLQPQMATAQANVNANLGAGGVSSNSSVAGIADSNLQAQEFADISAESANLTQSQEQLTAQILSGTEGAAEKEVATSDWSIFGQVVSGLGQDAAQAAGAIAKMSGV